MAYKSYKIWRTTTADEKAAHGEFMPLFPGEERARANGVVFFDSGGGVDTNDPAEDERVAIERNLKVLRFKDIDTGEVWYTVRNLAIERLVDPEYGCRWWVNFFHAQTPGSAAGGPQIQPAGNIADASDATMSYELYSSTAPGLDAGMRSLAANGARLARDPEMVFFIKTGSAVADMSFQFGLTEDVAANCHGGTFGVRAVAICCDAANANGWVGAANDGTTESRTASLGAIAANTAYKLRVRYSVADAKAYFSINGGAEVSLATNLPATTQALGFFATCSPGSLTTAQVALGRIVFRSK